MTRHVAESAETHGPITLALSGGGFRATLFHLGVIRFLYETGQLERVTKIGAVSGGSILAAHLLLNWSDYTGAPEAFDKAASEILAFARKDVRGRIVRRWILWFPRILQYRRWTFTRLLQDHYAALYKNKTLSDLFSSAGPREVQLHCTSLTGGGACSFGGDAECPGFRWFEEGQEKVIVAPATSIAFAVAASSAFPPLFPPMTVSADVLDTSKGSFRNPQQLTDGGVYDNLGLRMLDLDKEVEDGTLFLVSDAEGHFDWDDRPFLSIINRNVRASNILMNRVSTLQYHRSRASGRKIVFVNMNEEITAKQPSEMDWLNEQVQRLLKTVRTDLDRFRSEEIGSLIGLGYAAAGEAAERSGLEWTRATNASPWLPAGSLPPHQELVEILRRSRYRRARLWAADDAASWGIAVLLVLVLALATHATVRAYHAWQDVGGRLQELAILKSRMEDDKNVEREKWQLTSRLLLHEVSDITRTTLTDEDNSPLVLAVDDDEPVLFLLKWFDQGETSPEDDIGIVRTLRFQGLDPNDLEGASCDPDTGECVVVTSHRDPVPLPDPVKNKPTERRRYFIRFSIPQDALKNPSTEITNAETFNVNEDNQLIDYLTGFGVVVQRGNPTPEFPLEIEGVAYRGGVAVLGLKWPLLNGEALLLWLNVEQRRIFAHRSVPLDGRSVTALSWEGDDLLIAANPAQQPSAETCGGDNRIYNQSELFSLRGAGTTDVKAITTAALERLQVVGVQNSCGKLEGFFRDGGVFRMAYEGARPVFKTGRPH